MDHWQRLRVGLGVFTFVVVGGTLGYVLLGFPFLDALYQTVTTITTVGFREIQPLGSGGRVFTIGLIVVGVGTALYTFTLAVQGVVEGEVGRLVGRRRMERSVARLSGHVIVCGWGRVGKAIAAYVTAGGGEAVVVDRDGGRLEDWSGASVVGDATDDGVLRAAGIERAHALVSALTSDADNLFVTLSGRSLRDDLFIVARARVPESEAKLTRAGANRVVNPQSIGGQRMAAFVLQPHVAEFLDVVMHEGSLEFRLEEVPIPPESSLAGRSLRDTHIRDETGSLVLAMRDADGRFITNPAPETRLEAGHILIAIGTPAQLEALERLAER